MSKPTPQHAALAAEILDVNADLPTYEQDSALLNVFLGYISDTVKRGDLSTKAATKIRDGLQCGRAYALRTGLPTAPAPAAQA